MLAMLKFLWGQWKGNSGHSRHLDRQAGTGQGYHGSGTSIERERKFPGNWHTGRMQAIPTGIVAAVFAAIPCLPFGEGQPLHAKIKAVLAVEARLPGSAGETVHVEAVDSRSFISIDPPAAPGSISPALAVEGPTTLIRNHQILMTWLEPYESGRRLKFARFSEQGWSRPITVAEPASTLGPTDRPSLTVFDTQAVRRTLIARTGEVVARSGDGGRTWSRLSSPTLPFASFAGGEEGGYVFWLATDGDDSAKLLGTRVLAGETKLDPLVAGGSATAAAMTWDGPVVVYRDRDAKGAQGIAIVRRHNGQWTLPRPVYPEGWQRELSPLSGPRVAALRRRVAVAWHTKAGSRPRVLVAFSDDAGRTFNPPVEVAEKERDREPQHFVDIALDGAGHALVLWMTTAGHGEATLNLARVAPDGNRGEELVLARGPQDRMGAIPQIALAGNSAAATWIEGAPSRIRATAVPLAGIPAPGSRRPGPGTPSRGTSRTQANPAQEGDSILNLEFVSLDGDKASLASLRGRAVLLNLWATWCLPCIKEIPELALLHKFYETAGLVVVGVSIDDADAIDKVRRFVSERKIPFPVWLDPEMQISRSLRVQGVPATFVIDRAGRIVLRRVGAITADDPAIGKALRRALEN